MTIVASAAFDAAVESIAIDLFHHVSNCKEELVNYSAANEAAG